MQNQWSFRTKSRLKAIDNSVKVSQVIGKKNSSGNPFYPSFTDEMVVLVSEDKRIYETTKASADGLGNVTFSLRGLADDGSDTEVTKFKRAWMPGTLMFVTLASQTIEAKQDNLIAGANIQIAADGKTISATDTIPNNATITIQKNGTDIESFTADESTNKTINITVPVTAADVSALPDSTKYGATVDMSINSSTYVVTLTLKDQDGNTLGSAQTIDLPLESVVVSGSYDAQTKKVILTLQDGSTIEFSVADLVAGLQTEITSSNKLDADLVDDTTSTNKFVTATEKSIWSGKQDTIVAGNNITINPDGKTINATQPTASSFDIKDLADSLGLRLTKAATVPNNPSQGDLWYDTTNNKLKTYDGNQWNESGGGGGGGSYSAGTGINIDGNNVISNTGVLSVNGNTGAVIVSEFEPDNVGTTDQILTKTASGYEWANAAGSDYSRVTKTISGGEVELGLRTIVDTPESDFTLTAPATLKDGEEYAIRIISETSYTMTLGTGFTNPRHVDTTLSGNATDQYVFLAIGGELELQPLVDTGA